MIWATDAGGEITYVGPEWTTFTGQEAFDARGSGWLTMVHPEDRDRICDLLRTALKRVATVTLRYRLNRADCGWAEVVAAAAPSMSPLDGRFVGYLGAICEVKDIKRATCGGAVDRLILPLPSHTMAPASPLDQTIDFILQAKAAAQGVADDAVFSALDLALSLLFLRLGSRASVVH